MADGISAADANAILNAELNGVAYNGHSALYAQLHIGAPGAAGTANPAANTTRQPTGSWTNPPTGGAATNAAGITWTNVPAAETYSHISLWTASSGGSFVASGAISGGTVTVGETFSIPAGDASVSLPTAS